MKGFVLLLCVLFAACPAFAAKQYSYFRVGNPNDISATTTPGTVLMGGGTDVDAAFQWMCQRSGGGDFLVIRATGTDAYNPYIQSLCPNENSVATLIIPNRTAASDPFVVNAIQKVEALWIAGGDQSNYINFWKGTPVETELNNLIARGAPIGGTSAGMNVLSEFLYSALASQGVTSSQALADPFSRYITLDRYFVNISILQGLLDDPHFVTRDRMGRDLAFMCRVFLNGWSSTPRDIAIDEQTALLIDASRPRHSSRQQHRLLHASPRRARTLPVKNAAHLPKHRRLQDQFDRHVQPRNVDRHRRCCLYRIRQRRRPEFHAARRLNLLTLRLPTGFRVCAYRPRADEFGYPIRQFCVWVLRFPCLGTI